MLLHIIGEGLQGRILCVLFLFLNMKFKIIIKYLFLSFIFYSCSSAPKFTSKNFVPRKANYVKAKTIRDSSGFNILNDPGNSNLKTLATEIGIASYYADKFNGKRTANGEIYNMYGLSAAHPTFPLGSLARVTNLKNGKSVIVKINDRMPKRPDRIIDLSLGAAKLLGMVKDGIARVKVEILKWGDNSYKKN